MENSLFDIIGILVIGWFAMCGFGLNIVWVVDAKDDSDSIARGYCIASNLNYVNSSISVSGRSVIAICQSKEDPTKYIALEVK